MNSSTSPCVFCSIATLEDRIVYSDALLYVLVPSHPVTSGHLLVIPVAHRYTFIDINLDELRQMQTIIAHVLARSKNQGVIGYNLLSNNGGALVDQHVAHFHQHCFLRDRNEGSPFEKLQNGHNITSSSSFNMTEHCQTLKRRFN